MLTIKTTESQILISKDGKEFEGLAKNNLRYKSGKDQLTFYLGNNTTAFVWEYWHAGITINDQTVTKDNVYESLDILFTGSKSNIVSEFPIGSYEAHFCINKKIDVQ